MAFAVMRLAEQARVINPREVREALTLRELLQWVAYWKVRGEKEEAAVEEAKRKAKAESGRR